jgi:predicted nucleotidyltransferase
MDAQRLVAQLQTALQGGPRLRLALVFGSVARGVVRPGSDIDVAIIPVDPNLELREELDLAARCSAACGREVDLLRLDRASPVVRWEVARNHLVLLAQPRHELPRFLARAALDHADLAPLLDDCQRRFHRRLLTSNRTEAV